MAQWLRVLCSCRGPQFNSQNSPGSSPMSEIPVLGNPTSLSNLWGYQKFMCYTYWHADKSTHTHNIQINHFKLKQCLWNGQWPISGFYNRVQNWLCILASRTPSWDSQDRCYLLGLESHDLCIVSSCGSLWWSLFAVERSFFGEGWQLHLFTCECKDKV